MCQNTKTKVRGHLVAVNSLFPLCGWKDCKNLPLKKKKLVVVVVMVHAFNPSRERQDKWISVSSRPQGCKEKPCLKKQQNRTKSKCGKG